MEQLRHLLPPAASPTPRTLIPLLAPPPLLPAQICTLREYLALEMAVPNLSFPFDLERVIDDFVLMCFFVGNDFLPHMPTLDIREGAIELMMRTYRDMLPELGGYLAHGSTLNLGRVEQFIQRIGSLEDTIFQKRMRELRRQKDRIARQKHERSSAAARRGSRDSAVASNAAPSAQYVEQAMAKGEIKAVKAAARPQLQFSAAAARKAEEEAEGREVKEEEGAKTMEGVKDEGGVKAPVDNKAAAARLRANILGKAGAKGGVKEEEGAKGEEEEGNGKSPPGKKMRGAEDKDVAAAAPPVEAQEEEEAKGKGGERARKGAVAAAAAAAAGGVKPVGTDGVSFADLQNMKTGEDEDEGEQMEEDEEEELEEVVKEVVKDVPVLIEPEALARAVSEEPLSKEQIAANKKAADELKVGRGEGLQGGGRAGQGKGG